MQKKLDINCDREEKGDGERKKKDVKPKGKKREVSKEERDTQRQRKGGLEGFVIPVVFVVAYVCRVVEAECSIKVWLLFSFQSHTENLSSKCLIYCSVSLAKNKKNMHEMRIRALKHWKTQKPSQLLTLNLYFVHLKQHCKHAMCSSRFMLCVVCHVILKP